MILEEQYYEDIPKIYREIPTEVQRELNRVYPGYELIFHGDHKWCLYKIKPGGLRHFQCELPGNNIGMWIFPFLDRMDRHKHGYSLNKLMAEVKAGEARRLRQRELARQDLVYNMAGDFARARSIICDVHGTKNTRPQHGRSRW